MPRTPNRDDLRTVRDAWEQVIELREKLMKVREVEGVTIALELANKLDDAIQDVGFDIEMTVEGEGIDR